MNTIVPITDAPLIYDISYYQEEFKYGKLPLGKQMPLAFYLNAGIGLVKDVQFARNWEKCGEWGYYRQSYWAYHPDYSHIDQLDKWYEQNPLIDMLPRIMDLERVKGVEPHIIAACVMEWSDTILARDGHRPWIYSRKTFLEPYILGYWPVDYIDEHYFILAEYNDYRNKEEEGIDIPALIEPDNVLMKQTADKMDPDPLGLCPGFLDRNRWLHGDEYQMDTFLVSTYGDFEIPPPTPTEDCCEELELNVIDNYNEINANAGDINNLYDFNTARMNDVMNLERSIGANASEIERLEAGRISLGHSIDNNISLIKGLNEKIDFKVDKLNARLDEAFTDITTQAQEIEDITEILEVQVSGELIQLNKRIYNAESETVRLEEDSDKFVGEVAVKFDEVQEQASAMDEANIEADNDLRKRIDGLAGGHSHPNWMYTLGLIKREE